MIKSKLLAAAAVVALIATPASAVDVQTDAGAKIVSTLAMTNTAPLYFGTIAPSNTTADTVLVASNGTKTCGPALTCLTDDHTAAAFNVTGDANNTYTITLPTSINIANSNGDTMEVSNFLGSKANGVLTNGSDSFSVGGTLNVGVSQADGDYTGTFQVTVEYP